MNCAHRNGELVIFGMAGHVAARMTSLLPKPLGTGTRNNKDKRSYLDKNLNDIEYRTLPCASRAEATEAERRLAANKKSYRFKT